MYKLSDVSVINYFMPKKGCILTKRNKVKKDRKPVPKKWLLKSKEEPDGIINLKP